MFIVSSHKLNLLVKKFIKIFIKNLFLNVYIQCMFAIDFVINLFFNHVHECYTRYYGRVCVTLALGDIFARRHGDIFAKMYCK